MIREYEWPAGLVHDWVQESVESIQDEVEPEFEVCAFVVGSVHRVFDDHLSEVGVLIGGYPLQEGFRDVLWIDVGSGRHVELLAAEAVDVAVEDRHSASRHVDGESGSAQGSEHPVEVVQPRGSAALS